MCRFLNLKGGHVSWMCSIPNSEDDLPGLKDEVDPNIEDGPLRRTKFVSHRVEIAIRGRGRPRGEQRSNGRWTIIYHKLLVTDCLGGIAHGHVDLIVPRTRYIELIDEYVRRKCRRAGWGARWWRR